jgi:hypothetical protein
MTAGTGDCFGHAAEVGAESGEGGYLASGWIVAFGTVCWLLGLTERTHLFEFRVAFRADIFVNRHDITPVYSLARFNGLVKISGCQLRGQGVGYSKTGFGVEFDI